MTEGPSNQTSSAAQCDTVMVALPPNETNQVGVVTTGPYTYTHPSGVCPTCGKCPTCGRPHQYPYSPYVPPEWYFPPYPHLPSLWSY